MPEVCTNQMKNNLQTDRLWARAHPGYGAARATPRLRADFEAFVGRKRVLRSRNNLGWNTLDVNIVGIGRLKRSLLRAWEQRGWIVRVDERCWQRVEPE